MKLTIIGASGHGKVVADIAKLRGYDEIEFLDDDENLTQCGCYSVVGKTDKALEIDNDVFIGIGNASIRKRFQEQLRNKSLVTLIHPDAVIADDVNIGIGTVIMAGAVINSGAKIGKCVIINTCSSVDHDCVVDDFAHVAVGAHLCGTVNVGESTWIGAGATVSNNVNVCENCMIGAGAVVIKDIEEEGTYIGVPVRKYR
ncbi:acetyltransferase [Ruminococcus albus]|uniref:Sugar O-acyltransferase, sialic acid O-acetyltransferase NeuD family n=1 Tax=Ruminococcus albus 8 TaxID=246199 RepID=E9S8A8_RUMAL|nr:acetyltransferase [Ruminococcus albus]EGC04499.1 sugar O-acyltransferase, sialic acid O-acetyltransferase NeuD family [Ruminococcus albus 8]MCC3352270.1 acetyltransferase [Ruminococcus albus 8]